MDSPKLNKLYLVLEYMKKGDLMKILNGDARRVECDPMCIKDVWHIFRQVTFNGAVLILYAAVAVVDVDIYIYICMCKFFLSHAHTYPLRLSTQGCTGPLISPPSEYYPW